VDYALAQRAAAKAAETAGAKGKKRKK
jgi:hypothetical protein